jgi:GTP-binding protein
MKFVDECEVTVHAGDGGNGCVAFRREKYVPHGGPSGGDGGRGGDVILEGAGGLSTLLDLTYSHDIRAKRGEHGQGKDCYGRAGEDVVLRVPVGTRVTDLGTGEVIGEVLTHGQKIVAAKGGTGGRGNIHFSTPYDRAPRRAEAGVPGEVRKLKLSLVVMADVGLLGFPNVGKSTLIRAVSRARPRVDDFPFTTLRPHLGIVSVGGGPDPTQFAMADIPGLIPGASEGAGLGIRFLKHLERTRVLLHLVTIDHAEDRDPWNDYVALREELARFDEGLAAKPEIVALSKGDLTDVREAYPALRSLFAERGVRLELISAATGENTQPVMAELAALVAKARATVQDDAPPTEDEAD